jgi:hypothetical protein
MQSSTWNASRVRRPRVLGREGLRARLVYLLESYAGSGSLFAPFDSEMLLDSAPRDSPDDTLILTRFDPDSLDDIVIWRRPGDQ